MYLCCFRSMSLINKKKQTQHYSSQLPYFYFHHLYRFAGLYFAPVFVPLSLVLVSCFLLIIFSLFYRSFMLGKKACGLLSDRVITAMVVKRASSTQA